MNIILRNNGSTILGVLIASAVGIVVVAGITKSMLTFSEQSSKIIRERDVAEVVSNLKNIMRSRYAWRSTINKAISAGQCIPGQNIGGHPCSNMRFFYNPSTPDDQATYDAGSRRWTINFIKDGNHIGVGFFDVQGNIKYPCPGAKTPTAFQNCFPNEDLVKVEIYPPATLIHPAATNPSMPDFQIRYSDINVLREVASTTVMSGDSTVGGNVSLEYSENWGFVPCNSNVTLSATCPANTVVINCTTLFHTKPNARWIFVQAGSSDELSMRMEGNSCLLSATITSPGYCNVNWGATAICLKF